MASSINVFRDAANLGNAEAMMYLGVMYGAALGAELNYAESKAWFLKAADKGNAQAMTNIGLLYYRGLGQPQIIARL